MTLTQLYLFTVILPNTYKTLDFLSGICVVAIIACWIIAFVMGITDEEAVAVRFFKASIKLCYPAVILGLLCIPLPSEKQLYLLAGGYVATNTKDVAKLPDNVVKAANAWLEKAADSAQDKKKTQ